MFSLNPHSFFEWGFLILIDLFTAYALFINVQLESNFEQK